MDEEETEARLFCHFVGSHYLAEIYKWLSLELTASDNIAQARALDELMARLRQARDLIEQRLAQRAEGAEHVVQN